MLDIDFDKTKLDPGPMPHRGPLDINLFKYRRFGKYTDQIFLDNALYFSKAVELNDPYEFREPLDHGIVSRRVRERLEELLNRKEITDVEKAQIEYFFPASVAVVQSSRF